MIAAARDAGPVRRGPITVAVMLATIMQALDTTIANVALPHMQGSLSATIDQISWVLTSYIVASAIMTPPTGFLATRFGRKRLFMASVTGFTLASVLCGLATTLDQIVLFRLLQGMFGAGLVPLSQVVLLDTYPRERHGQAMALWGIGVMVGPILGPTLGGYITEYYSWRWVFFINVPFGMAALLGILAFVPDTERNATQRFDWFGFTLLSVTIGALQLLLDRGQTLGWFASGEIIAEAVAAGLCFYLFIVHMLTAERPFLEPALFRDRNLVTGLFFIFVLGVMLFSTLVLLPPFLQNLMGFPVITTGLVLAPRGVGTMIAMFIVGRLIGRVDIRLLLATGLLLTALSLWQMAGFNLNVSRWDIIDTGMTQGLGLGFLFVPLSTVTFSTLTPRLRTEATAVYSLMRNIGSSIGISVVITLLAQNTQINHASLAGFITDFNPALAASNVATYWDLGTAAGRLALNGEITRQAAAIAYLDDFRLMMYLSLAAIPLLVLFRTTRRAPPDELAAAID